VGHGQTDPFRVVAPRWQAHRVGLRLGRATSSALQPVVDRVQIGPDGTEMPYEGARAGISTLRGAIPPGPSAPAPWPKRSRKFWRQFGLQNEPIGVDVIEMPVLAAFAKEE